MSYGNVFQLKKEGDIGIVTFEVSSEAMNTWTEEAISEFLSVLGDLETSEITGAIFISKKPGNFHAGANLKVLDQMKDKDETSKALDVFHSAFKRLNALKFPTLAAIEGHCLGGGLEFALACTARLAKASKTTVLGLPECSLGLFPGAGGTQRLPRLIGYGAIELILKGKIIDAKRALALGIIDKLVSEKSDLVKEAVAFMKLIVSGEEVLERKEHDFSQIDAISDMARKEVLKVTKGREIPGPMLAIKSIQEGLKVSLTEALEIEKQNFVKAVLSDQAKGGIHTFFLKTMSDKPQTMMSKGFTPQPLNSIAVLGFGTMGRGIVIDVLRRTKIPVVVKDIPESLEPGRVFVEKVLNSMSEKGRLKTPVEELLNRLTVTSEYIDEFKEVDLLVEAVFEDIKVKEKVYNEISAHVKKECIIATNTSSLSVNSMAQYVTRPERFGGAHFFSPVWLMQLVEIIRGDQTDQETVDNLLNFAAVIRKRPIVCKDNPGFVVNAVLFPYFMDSLDFLESGNSIENIDGAFMQFGMPVGPIRLIDEVGIDVCYYVVKGKGLDQETLKNIVKDGRLGQKKSGKGFFDEDGKVDPEVLHLIDRKDKQEMGADEMQRKVLTDMVTIGKDLLDKGIVTDPRMIDIGMIWGTGFPPDRGGPMKWADLTGLSHELFGMTFY